jgi:hypothetical protein
LCYLTSPSQLLFFLFSHEAFPHLILPSLILDSPIRICDQIKHYCGYLVQKTCHNSFLFWGSLFPVSRGITSLPSRNWKIRSSLCFLLSQPERGPRNGMLLSLRIWGPILALSRSMLQQGLPLEEHIFLLPTFRDTFCWLLS